MIGPNLSNGFGNLQRQAHATRKVSAISIGPHIGQRREQLMQQKAVARIDVDDIEPGLMARLAAAAKAQVTFWISDSHFTRYMPVLASKAAPTARWFPTTPRRAGHILIVEGTFLVPGPALARLASGVRQLDSGHRTLGMGEGGNACKRRYLAVFHKPRSPWVRRPRDKNQSGTAQGKAGKVREMPVVGMTVPDGILAHGRHNDAEGKGHATQRERRVRHRLSLTRAWYLSILSSDTKAAEPGPRLT